MASRRGDAIRRVMRREPKDLGQRRDLVRQLRQLGLGRGADGGRILRFCLKSRTNRRHVRRSDFASALDRPTPRSRT